MIFYFIIIIVFALSLPAYGLLLEKCIYDYISGKYGNTCALLGKISVFLSCVRWFDNGVYEWRSHEWKSLANHLTREKKLVILNNKSIILYLTRYLLSCAHNYTKNNHQ